MQKLFEKNIKFFYHNLPQYYKLITNIKKNYYLKNDNLYDINHNAVYPVSITEDSLRFASYPTHNDLWQKDFFYIRPYYWQNKFNITGEIINEILNTAQSLNSYTHEGFYFDKNFLPTTIIYGLLAGKHLELLTQKFEFHSLFVYEPNPEFFAISMYFVDYEKIYSKLKERFYLWVNGTINTDAIYKFYHERKITSTFLNLSLTTYNHPLIEDANSKFEEIRQTKLRGWGTFEDEYKGIKNHLLNINKYKVFKFKTKTDKPVCVVANGKSLEKTIPFIKKNQNSMIIISVGTAIKPLLNAGIQSDFHIEQERIEQLPQILHESLKKYNGYFVGASVVNPKVFEYAKKPLLYFREAFTLSEKEYVIEASSPIVGNTGFALAALIGGEIYLCGMDLGYRLNEKKHAKGSFYDTKDDTAKDGIKVKGNFSDDIYSNSLLLSSKYKIEYLIKQKSLKVYNLSDGAFIQGAVPLKDKNLPEFEKQKEINKILENFTDTRINVPEIDLNKIIKPVINTLNFKIKDYKGLTGLIDFIIDKLDESFFYYPKEYTLLRGSLYHIFNNLYITAHKIDNKEYFKLVSIIQKKLPLYNLEIEKLIKYSENN